MKRIKKIVASFMVSVLLSLGMPLATMAAPTHTLFGEAHEILDGTNTVIETVSDVNNVNMFGGIAFDVPSGTTFAALTTLSTDFNVTNDDCGGGSPRFQVAVDTDNDGTSNGNVWIYLGPSPGFTDCPTGWQSSGNLIGNTDAGRFDFTNLGGPLGTYANAPANVLAGEVLSVELVIDSSWSAAATGGDGEQTVWFDNVNINGTLHDFEPEVEPPTMPTSKDDCKKGGWMNFEGVFKNQGDCVSWIATHGTNPASGLASF